MRPEPHSMPRGFQWITRAVRHSATPGSMMIEAETSAGETVRNLFTSYGEGIWQWTIIPHGESEPPATGMLVPDLRPQCGPGYNLLGIRPIAPTSGSHRPPHLEAAPPGAILLTDAESKIRIDPDPWYVRLRRRCRRSLLPGEPCRCGRSWQTLCPPLRLRQGGLGCPEHLVFVPSRF